MINPYYDYLLNNSDIISKTKLNISIFDTLTKYEIEVLISYLKSIHTYTPNIISEFGKTDKIFLDKLENLKKESEKYEFNTEVKIRLKLYGMLFSSGLIFSTSLFFAFQSYILISIVGILISIILFFKSETSYLKCHELIKTYDRRYFLNSIREAKNLEQLRLAGLFAYTNTNENFGDHTTQNTIRYYDSEVAKIITNLSDAIYNFDPE